MLHELKKDVYRIIEKRNLCSYMNNTKWEELITAIRNEMPLPPPFEMKYLTQDDIFQSNVLKEDVDYWGDWYGEHFPPKEYYFNIEWLKVRPRYLKYRGKLITHEVVDESKIFEAILIRYNIPYVEENGLYCIYGYR